MSENDRALPILVGLGENYEIVRELGRGGTAVVYLARDTDLEREVAVKVIRTTFVEDEEAMARLTREAKTVAGLQHPNIVGLYGTRKLEDNSLALIMQYVPGRSLKALVRDQGPLTYAQAGQILVDVARALTYAHRRRIVHRDIKPENIYLDEEAGVARLSDFGIARPWDTDSNLTLPGMALGTPAYMSPEQIDGRDLDGRSDLFSLGLVGYEMLTGRQPWAGENLYTIIYRQKQDELPSLSELRPDIPTHLQRAIEVALQKNSVDRWANAEDFVQQVLAGPLPATAPPTDLAFPVASGNEEGVGEDAATIMYRRLESEEDDEAGGEEENGGAVGLVPAPPVPTPIEHLAPVPPAAPTPAGRGRLRAAVAGVLLVGAAFVAWSVTRTTQAGPTPGSGVPVVSTPRDGGSPPVGPQGGITEPDETPDGGVPSGGAQAPVPVVGAATVFTGEGQEADPGTTLPNALVVRVVDADGAPIEGATVRFEAVSGGGFVMPDSAQSDVSGFASAQWTLGFADGPQEATASIDGLPGPPLLFAANEQPLEVVAVPAAIALVEGGDQQALPGEALPVPLVLEVMDAEGQPVQGVVVRFAVTAGGGSLSPAEAVTDSTGRASSAWVLGSGTDQTSSVVAQGLEGRPVTVTARAVAPPLRIRRTLAAGATHTCALSGEGATYCWGGNQIGQLGDGGDVRRTTPGLVDGTLTLAVLAAGFQHTCGIQRNGQAVCWGGNESGQLGDGTTGSAADPVDVVGGVSFSAIDGGTAHTCALAPGGSAYCWGANGNGQLGDGSRSSRGSPGTVVGGRRFASLAAGWNHTCALSRGGVAYCWGRNAHGQLGDGSLADRLGPTPVSEVPAFRSISAGSAHTCGVTAGGEAFCWGQNLYGQLGNGTTQNSRVPVRVEGLEEVVDIVAGGVHTCALTEAGAAYCWGRNTYGQLGDGAQQDRTTPVPTAGEVVFASLFASGAHSCGSTSSGRSYCWGYNADGQLGDGSRTNRSSPTPVLRLPR